MDLLSLQPMASRLLAGWMKNIWQRPTSKNRLGIPGGYKAIRASA